jgi:hypothetical protein
MSPRAEARHGFCATPFYRHAADAAGMCGAVLLPAAVPPAAPPAWVSECLDIVSRDFAATSRFALQENGAV